MTIVYICKIRLSILVSVGLYGGLLLKEKAQYSGPPHLDSLFYKKKFYYSLIKGADLN
jgi:hypothetical protein